VIRYYVRRDRFNCEIQTKLCPVYRKDAVCPRTVDLGAAHFWSGRTSVKDDKKPGKASRDNLSAAIPGFFETSPHASCHEIAKGVFIPRTSILRVLGKMSFRFFIIRRVCHELSARLKAKRVKIFKEMLEVVEELDLRQKIMSLWIKNARFIRIITLVDNEQWILRQYPLESVQRFRRKNHLFGLLHLARVPNSVENVSMPRPQMQIQSYEPHLGNC
jgi:hypothetical protein